MAIDTNAMTLGGSAPAKSSFQARASGSGTGQVANDQNPGADPGSQSAASHSSGGDTPAATAATTAKSAGPSAQTRSNARASRPAKASVPTGAAPAAATEVTAESSTDFGSVMASTLGRSAASTAAPTAPGAPAATATNAADAGSTPAQADAGASAAAVAWIAQVLMPPTAAVHPGTAPGAGQATTDAALIGPVSAAATATAASISSAAAAAATGQPAAAAAAALRARSDGLSLPQDATPQTGAVSTPATEAAQATPVTTLDSLNAMADVQKLISGMTAANSSGSDANGDPNASDVPPAHATTTSPDGAQAAAALQAAALTRTDTLGSATLSIQAPVGSAAFADEVSARVSGLAQSGITQAQLQLSPADLGPVQVHITLQAGQASVWFGANHADTRAALEQSLPQLRELFAGAGMPLTDSGVFREPPQQQQAQSLPSAGSARSSGSDALNAPTVTQVSNIRLSLLDTYA